MIDRPQGVTVDDAARDLECTIRTIWRDLDALQKAGFPLYTERAAGGTRGVWRVTEDVKRTLPARANGSTTVGDGEISSNRTRVEGYWAERTKLSRRREGNGVDRRGICTGPPAQVPGARASAASTAESPSDQARTAA
jgi:hypothetical protein